MREQLVIVKFFVEFRRARAEQGKTFVESKIFKRGSSNVSFKMQKIEK